jgi:triosephosphate isomerase (TIM)
MASRTPLMAGNWKMNVTHPEAVALVQKLAWILADKKHDFAKTEVVVIPPYTDLRSVQTVVDGDHLSVRYGAQDVSAHDSGAYTGEISATMLAKLGCSYVVVGHSERREYHAESDETVNAKARQAVGAGMTPIVCVGEGLDVRKAGEQVPYTLAQVDGSLAGFTPQEIASLVVAYEPVWAIGTGVNASGADAAAMADAIRRKARVAGVGLDTPILYGGSVTSANIGEFFAEPAIDGALVGGASLKPDEMAGIVARAAVTARARLSQIAAS